VTFKPYFLNAIQALPPFSLQCSIMIDAKTSNNCDINKKMKTFHKTEKL